MIHVCAWNDSNCNELPVFMGGLLNRIISGSMAVYIAMSSIELDCACNHAH